MPDALHAQAVELFSTGKTADAVALLRRAIREAVDLDVLNDLAVMLAGDGDPDAARELLVTLRHVDPEHEGAAENLGTLGVHTGTGMAEARERFFQVIADAQQVRLA